MIQKHEYVGHLVWVDQAVHLWIENPFLWHIESVADLISHESNLRQSFLFWSGYFFVSQVVLSENIYLDLSSAVLKHFYDLFWQMYFNREATCTSSENKAVMMPPPISTGPGRKPIIAIPFGELAFLTDDKLKFERLCFMKTQMQTISIALSYLWQ